LYVRIVSLLVSKSKKQDSVLLISGYFILFSTSAATD